MPRAKHDEDVQYGSNIFCRLKSKGEKVTFRIGNAEPYYDGKHWTEDANGKWTSADCPRIMEKAECELCKQAFALRKQMDVADEKEKKGLEKLVRAKQVKISWYYPILNRETGEAAILQTTPGVRNKFREETKNGIDVLAYDYILTRTEKPGSDYYALTRKDSMESPKLTKEEKKELKRADQLLEDTLVNPTKEEEVDTEKVSKDMDAEEVAKEMGGKVEEEVSEIPF